MYLDLLRNKGVFELWIDHVRITLILFHSLLNKKCVRHIPIVHENIQNKLEKVIANISKTSEIL